MNSTDGMGDGRSVGSMSSAGGAGRAGSREAVGTAGVTGASSARATRASKLPAGVRVARGFTLFMNWFDGICAVGCGGWMALGALVALPVSWSDCMDIAFLSNMPLADVFFTTWFWPGLALMLVNGLPNVIALVLRFRGNRIASYTWSIVAGALLMCWTVFEMLFIPNPLSVFYLVLGVAQLGCAIVSRRSLTRVGA